MNKYLDDNLFFVDERRLLLKELLPRARDFGDDHIKRINERIELHKQMQQDLRSVNGGEDLKYFIPRSSVV